jgi:hypothetical protein
MLLLSGGRKVPSDYGRLVRENAQLRKENAQLTDGLDELSQRVEALEAPKYQPPRMVVRGICDACYAFRCDADPNLKNFAQTIWADPNDHRTCCEMIRGQVNS